MIEVQQIGGRLAGPRWRSTLLRLARSGRYDGVVVTHAESFDLIDRVADLIKPPVLLDFQNVNSRWYRALRDSERIEFWDAEETRIMAAVAAVLACSQIELDSLPLGRARGAVAQNGVELAEWPSVQADRVPNRLVAFGSWWYLPNRRGLEWFLVEVWPRIRAEVPDAHLQLAGTGAPPIDVGRDIAVEHVGRVDDVAGFLRSASVVVMPLIDSPGTPVKFAEALAAGTPLVATSSAADGFPSAPCILTNDPEAFAKACVKFLGSPEAREHAAGEARAFAEQNCQWSQTQRPLIEWAESLGARGDAS